MSDSVQGCLSLSATATNVLMWSHYAQNHEGYVIGFDADHEYFGESVSPVIYSSVRPPHNPFEHRHSGAIFYTKSADWSYEQEYRKFHSFVEPIKLENGNYLLPIPASRRPLWRQERCCPVSNPTRLDFLRGTRLEVNAGIAQGDRLLTESIKLQHVQIYAARPSPIGTTSR